MKREIKFRAFVKDRMQYSGQLGTSEFNNWHEVLSQGIFPESPILMQYTGLKDKNGKDIYEGDIVTAGSDFRYVVKWSNNLMYVLTNKDAETGIISEYSDLKVIGNIWENPEFLPHPKKEEVGK